LVVAVDTRAASLAAVVGKQAASLVAVAVADTQAASLAAVAGKLVASLAVVVGIQAAPFVVVVVGTRGFDSQLLGPYLIVHDCLGMVIP